MPLIPVDSLTKASVYYLLQEYPDIHSIDTDNKKIVFNTNTNKQFVQCCACDLTAEPPGGQYDPDDDLKRDYRDYRVELFGEFDGKKENQEIYCLPHKSFYITIPKVSGTIKNTDVFASSFLIGSSNTVPEITFLNCNLNMKSDGVIFDGCLFNSRKVELNCNVLPGYFDEEYTQQDGIPQEYIAPGPIMPRTICMSFFYSDSYDQQGNPIPIPGIGYDFIACFDKPLQNTFGTDDPRGEIIIYNKDRDTVDAQTIGTVDYLTGRIIWSTPSYSGNLIGLKLGYCGGRISSIEEKTISVDTTRPNSNPLSWCQLNYGSIYPGTFKYYPNTSGITITDVFLGVTDKGERYGKLVLNGDDVGTIYYDLGFICSYPSFENTIQVQYQAISYYRQGRLSLGSSFSNCAVKINMVYKDFMATVGDGVSTHGFLSGGYLNTDILVYNAPIASNSYFIYNTIGCFLYVKPLQIVKRSVSNIRIYRSDSLSICVESEDGPSLVMLEDCSGRTVLNTDRIKYTNSSDVSKVAIQVDGQSVPSNYDFYEYTANSSSPNPGKSRIIPATDLQMSNRNYLYDKGFFG